MEAVELSASSRDVESAPPSSSILDEVPPPRDPDEINEEPQVDVAKGVEEFQQIEKELRDLVNQEGSAGGVEAQSASAFDLASFLEGVVRESDTHGIKRKKVGVVFKNMTVVGEGADASSIPNLLTPLEDLWNIINPLRWLRKRSKGTDFDILHNLTGFCKDGEMLLVLGRPGSGCSTFLRVIANQRSSYKAVTGDVAYGGVPALQFERFQGETIYTAEEDVHFPTLTVRQTLTAALKCKTPHKRTNEQTRHVFVGRLMEMLLKIFGLTKQIDTPVGNEWIRGLSGGERKRLTIAEAMTARAAVNCWDCTTRGLDAASALDYTRSLRIMSNTIHKTTIASFYQASEDMYALFDKVLVLDKGVCVYFGPAATAKAYFQDLGFECEARKSTPDFLTGITNPNERKIRKGFENTVPKTAAEMELRYLHSATHDDMAKELTDYETHIRETNPAKDFEQNILDAKASYTRDTSVYLLLVLILVIYLIVPSYVTNFWIQVRTLLVREFQLIAGDKGAIFGKIFSVLSKSFIYATAFLLLDVNVEGAFNRGGALFISVLFNSLISLSELPNALRGRRVLQKHKSYAMYHPSAYHIATVATDIPITMLQVTLYSLCAYFLFGLQYDAGKFFIFLFTLLLTSLTMTEFFRFCGNIASSYFAASQMANICLVLLLLYSGYLIPYTQMHDWFSWIYWANPMAYAFKAIFSNEMKGLVFPCSGENGVPFGPTYTDDTARACRLPGHVQGTYPLEVRAEAYLKSYYDYDTSQMNVDIIAVFLFWLLYIGLNCAAMELYDLGSGGYTRQVFKKGKAPKQNDANAVVQQQEVDLDLGKGGIESKNTTTFTWKDVEYTVPVKGGTRLLLDKVEGWIKPGQMTALMGSSGAGKTTLLDVLAKRKTIGEIKGTILLNGEPLRIDFERLTGYVEQQDVANPSITVREALRFSARMRQDPGIPLAEKYEYVEKVLGMMEMSHLGDALIGDLESGLGISVEERKRLTIGMELVGKPEILFLDEPTSGLDAQSSYNIVKFIRKLADSGMPLVCTIHQPSSVLFEYFDRLLLLARGGKTVYFGDIGPNSRIMLDYFERNGAPRCEDHENPAEYILRAIGAGVSSTVTQDWAATWKSSQESHSVHEELQKIEEQGKSSGAKSRKHTEFATSGRYQFYEVYSRMNLVWWRNPTYNYGRFMLAVIISLIDGFSFYNLSNSYRDLQSRVFAIFSVLIMGNSLIILAQPMFMRQRQYFRREYASKFYGWWQFAVSMILVELPYLVANAAIFILLFYWTAGLDSTAINGFYVFIAFISFMFFSVSFGQVIAAFCGSVAQAAVLNPFFTPFLILFAGVLIPPKSLPGFWHAWMYPLDPYHYFLEGVVTTVLNPVPVVCKAAELVRFPVASNFTNCGEYMSAFLSYAPGYVENPQDTANCAYCPYASGTEFYEQFDWSNDHRWRNYGIMWGYFCFNIALVIFFVFLFRKPKR